MKQHIKNAHVDPSWIERTNPLSCHSGRGIFRIDLGEGHTKSVNNIHYLNIWHEEFERISEKY